MKIFSIKAFSDNYIWLIEEKNELIIIDPGESHRVITYLDSKSFDKISVFLTHNHQDHTGGVEKIVEAYPNTKVYGPIETKELNDVTVEDGDSFKVGVQNFDVIKTAGHTEEHISYVTENELFCGDALFSAGCGRVFTKDYQLAYEGLQKIKNLPAHMSVYAGHEYTETNLKFAHSIEPSNPDIENYLNVTKKLRADGVVTLPTTIGKEKQINLFLQADTVEKFTKLRKMRDQF